MRTPLHIAVEENKIEDIKNLIDQFRSPRDINALDDHHLTPLHLAVRVKNINIVKLLLDGGADFYSVGKDAHEEDYKTPFNLALKLRDAKILKLFLDAIKKRNLSLDSFPGGSPLHAAVMWGNLEMIKMLIDHGANVNNTNYRFDSPLHWAIRRRNLNVLKLLINSGADWNAENYFSKNTPLHTAVYAYK